jgi:hypothetical protein
MGCGVEVKRLAECVGRPNSAHHHVHSIMKNECAVCLLDSDGEDRMTPATVLVHVMAAHSPVSLPLSHQLVHLQEREEECRQGE